MVVIAVIVGVVWVLLITLVLAMCRAAGRTDAQEERWVAARAGVTQRDRSADLPPEPMAGAPPIARQPRRVRLPGRVA